MKAKGCLVPVNVGGLRRVCAAGLSTGLVGAEIPGRKQPTGMSQNQTPMSKVIHFIGLDVHKESVAVSIARASQFFWAG